MMEYGDEKYDALELLRMANNSAVSKRFLSWYGDMIKLHEKIEKLVETRNKSSIITEEQLAEDTKNTDIIADIPVQSESTKKEPEKISKPMSKIPSRVVEEYERLYNTLSAMCDDEHIVHGRYTTSEKFSPEAGPYQRYEFNGGLTVGKNMNKLIVSMGNPGVEGRKPSIIITSDSIMIQPYNGAEDRMCIYSSTNSDRHSYILLPTTELSEGKKTGFYERECRGSLTLYYIDQLLESSMYAADKSPKIADMYDDMSGLFRATMELTKVLNKEYGTPQEQKDAEKRNAIYQEATSNSVLEEAVNLLKSNGISLN